MNKIFYFLGLIVLVLNKIRHFFISYDHPRPIPKEEIKKNIDYDFEVANHFNEELKKYFKESAPFLDKKILEIGPGPDLGCALIYLSRGAETYDAIDRFFLLSKSYGFYDKLARALNFKYESVLYNEARKIKHGLANGNIEGGLINYHNLEADKIGDLKKKFNLILSRAVLEHIETSKMEESFKAMYDSLDNGGVIAHEIDFKTHTSVIRNLDPLNILRYSDGLYDYFKFSGTPNRLRLSDYIDIITKIGFKNVKITITNSLNEKRVAKNKKYLSKRFRNRDFKDLSTLSAMVIAKK